MRLSIKRKDLSPVIARAAEAKDGRPGAAARLRVDNGILYVAMSDSEMMVEASIQVDKAENAVVCVPPTKFCDAVKNLNGETVRLDTSSGRLVITSGGSSFRVPLLQEGSFREAPVDGIEYAPISGEVFRVAKLVSFAAPKRSLEEGKNSAYGVVVRRVSGKAMVFSNNEHRCCFTLLPEEAVGQGSVVLPIRLVESVEGEDLSYGDTVNLMAVKSDSCLTVCRKRSFNPPAVEQIMSRFLAEDFGYKHTMEVDRVKLLEAAKGCGVFQDDVIKIVKCRLLSCESGFTVSSIDVGFGAFESTIECSGGEIDITVDARYLADFLSRIDSDRVKMGYNGERSPLLMRGKSGDTELTYSVSSINI